MTDSEHASGDGAPVPANSPDWVPDADYVAGLKAGDSASWQRFMKEQGRLVLTVGRRLGLSDADREELFQSSCLVAYRSIAQLRDPTRLSSWVYSIAYRQGIGLAARRRAEAPSQDPELNPVDSLADPEPPADRVLEELEHSFHIRDAVAGLGHPCRLLLEALYLDSTEPSYTAISSQLQMPIGSIGPTRARCLEKLRRMLLRVSDASPLGSTLQETPEWTGRESRRKKP